MPDSILHKPGPLDDGERDRMRRHTTVGAEILAGSRSSIVRMAEEIALTHHEHWDGSGYPRGLRGTEIPLVGRICAVGDVFDALISARPYKHAWSITRRSRSSSARRACCSTPTSWPRSCACATNFRG